MIFSMRKEISQVVGKACGNFPYIIGFVMDDMKIHT